MLLLPLFEKGFILAQKIFRGVYVNLVAAAIIVLIGFILGKLLSKLTYKILRELELRSALKESGVRTPLERSVSTAVAYLVYLIAIIMALRQLKLATVILYVIIMGVLIIFIVSFLLSLKDFVPNLKAGFSLYKHRALRRGEVITVQGITGTVTRISLTKIRLETKEGDIVYIPHVTMLASGFTRQKSPIKSRKKTQKKAKS